MQQKFEKCHKLTFDKNAIHFAMTDSIILPTYVTVMICRTQMGKANVQTYLGISGAIFLKGRFLSNAILNSATENVNNPLI